MMLGAKKVSSFNNQGCNCKALKNHLYSNKLLLKEI